MESSELNIRLTKSLNAHGLSAEYLIDDFETLPTKTEAEGQNKLPSRQGLVGNEI